MSLFHRALALPNLFVNIWRSEIRGSRTEMLTRPITKEEREKNYQRALATQKKP